MRFAFDILIELNILDSNWSEVIKQNHNYEAVLHGESLGPSLNLYTFWHSDQTQAKGNNLALFSNTDLDEAINQSLKTINEDEKKALLNKIQEIIHKEKPATRAPRRNAGICRGEKRSEAEKRGYTQSKPFFFAGYKPGQLRVKRQTELRQ